MKIETKYQGTRDIADNEIIHFESGIPGFLKEQQFVVSPFSEGTPFFILQSVETPSLAFVMADPFSFYPDYDFTISDAVTEQLKIESEQDVSVYVVLTLHDPFEQTTANLQAPVIINYRKQKGKQVVLDSSEYGTRHKLTEKLTPTGRGEQGC
jgi:flagellar assembly factor FliW